MPIEPSSWKRLERALGALLALAWPRRAASLAGGFVLTTALTTPASPLPAWRRRRRIDLLELARHLLLLRERGVDAAAAHELGVRALLDDPPFVEDDDAVAPRRGGDAVGDEDDGAPRGLALDRAEDRALGLRVDGGERVVQDEDLRLPHERAREGDALLLAARELHAALADDRVEAVGQRERLLEHLRLARGLADLRDGLGRVGIVEREADVARDGRREEKRVLLRVAHGGPHRSQRELAHVDAVHPHGAVGRRQEAREEHRERRLPRSRAPDDGERLPGRHLEAHVVEHLARRRTRT